MKVDDFVKRHQDGWQSRGTVTVPLLNRRNDENGTFYEAIKICFLDLCPKKFL